jgi:hypothetical protein
LVFLCTFATILPQFYIEIKTFFISNCPYCSITSIKKLAARNPPKFNTHKKSANSICEGFWFRSSYIGGSHEQAFSLFLLDLDVRGLRDEGGGMRDEGGRFRFRFRFRFRRFRFRQSCFNHIISKDTYHLQDIKIMNPDLAVHYI